MGRLQFRSIHNENHDEFNIPGVEVNKDQTTHGMISIVIPAHNEAEGIKDSIQTIADIVETCATNWEIIVVDDGSSDATFAQVSSVSSNRNRIKALRFSRNFGKEAALVAGLQMATGSAVITIDADLQHPPRLIPEMIDKWRAGAQVVDGVKRNRDQDSMLVKLRAKIFNTLLSRLSGIDIQNSSDFKLLDRIVVNAIISKLPERRRFYRGLVDWVGYNHETLLFDIESRAKGEGKWSLWGLIGLATTAVISFTSTPLRIVTFLGFFTLIFGFFVAAEALWSWVQGQAVSGFATLIITLLLLGSFIMISLGILGEYLAKVYDEIKARPAFLIAESVGFDSKTNTTTNPTEDQVCASCGRPFSS
jgi:glycosyltransferase involved in cell wall biosynthesis